MRTMRWIPGLCVLLCACGDDTKTTPENTAPQGLIVAPSADASVLVGASVTFAATCEDDGEALTHAWDFDGGAPASTAVAPGPVAFNQTGVFQVTYTCVDSEGLADRTPAAVTITVTEPTNAPPVAAVTAPAGDVTIDVGDSVDFEASCTDPEGGSVTHAWDFDGGASASTDPSPGSVVFATAGEFNVSYTCTDDRGDASATVTRVVTVAEVAVNVAPDGAITTPSAATTLVAPGSTLSFEGTCTDPEGDPVTQVWQKGGVDIAETGLSADITFDTLGTFVISLVCTDEQGATDATPPTHTVNVQNGFTLSGWVTFDKVRATPEGLDYANIEPLPARHIDILLVDAADPETTLATTTTDDDGYYTLVWADTLASEVTLVAVSRIASPRITVANNTNDGATYAVSSETVDALDINSLDLHISSGWTGTAYAHRDAAPFAVLDAAYSAARAFLDVRPAAVFADLPIFWSADNVPVEPIDGETDEQAAAAGHIGTSHWDDQALYILGAVDVDTDEFDDHIIVHEWGHYFESKLGRSDSPGGTHSGGDVKDPRLAFGEGWGNALGAIVFAPETTYSDSTGVGQAEGFGFDLEDNVGEDETPGWFSESSVQALLFDLFDDSGTDEAFDGVALGLGPIYDAMVGAQKETSAMTTLFSLIHALKTAQPASAAAIDALCLHRGVFGMPVVDAFGTGETNDAGAAENLPVYNTFDNGAVDVTFVGGGLFNNLGQMRYVVLEGDGLTYIIETQTTDAQDVDLRIYRAGVEVASSRTDGDESSEPFTTEAGVTYIILVEGLGTLDNYTSTVTVAEVTR